MNYEFHPEALSEFEDAARYYAEKQVGLEHRFIETLRRQSRSSRNVRQATPSWSKTFGVASPASFHTPCYTPSNRASFLFAFMHCRQKPGYWRHRVAS